MAEDKKVEESSADDRQSTKDGAPEVNKKHLLERPWTLWFDGATTKQSQNQWGASLRPVYTFDSVEDFWCLYNNIKTPSQFTQKAAFYLFQDKIQPKWEDPKNGNGGSWTVAIPRTPPNQIDTWWLNAILGCIGEQFPDGDEICGVSVLIRPKGNRMELWTKTASNEAIQVAIGKQLKQILDIGDSTKLGYAVHSESASSGSSGKGKDRYQV